MNGQNYGNGNGGSGSNANPASGSEIDNGSCPSKRSPKFPYQLSPKQKNTKKKKNNSQHVNEHKVVEAYQNFIKEMNEKGYDIDISEERFLELCRNPQTNKFDKKSIFEVEGNLQVEVEGNLYINLQRTRNPNVDLDFEAKCIKTGKTIFVDHKGMIDFGSLSDKGIDISTFPSHETVAFNMGKDSIAQKERFIGLDRGPKSKSDVVHVYNFRNIRNNAEKPALIQAVLNGAEQAGYTDGIHFIKYK